MDKDPIEHENMDQSIADDISQKKLFSRKPNITNPTKFFLQFLISFAILLAIKNT